MNFRQMLLGSAARLRAPEDDTGSEYDDPIDEVDEVEEELEDPEDEVEPPEEDDYGEREDRYQEPEPVKPSRAESRVREATRIAAEAKARTEALERELAAMRQQSTTPRETPQQLQERLSMMEPWERTEYLRQQDRNEFQTALQRIEFNAQDSADKTAYEAMAARTPIAAKLKADVEARLADMRKNNMTAPRETILKYLIGERALANTTRSTTKARKAADGRQAQHAARPGNGRGDAVETGRRGNDAQARRKRLENMNI